MPFPPCTNVRGFPLYFRAALTLTLMLFPTPHIPLYFRAALDWSAWALLVQMTRAELRKFVVIVSLILALDWTLLVTHLEVTLLLM